MVTIVQKESSVLRKVSQTVKKEEIGSKNIKSAIRKMKEALHSQKDGVAIAAPQIGILLRIFVVSKNIFDDERLRELSNIKSGIGKDLVCINPEITKISKKKIWLPEGCLSVRWLYGEVRRADKATISAYDESGKKFTRGASGLLAQIFQHETDHLDGILFTDKVKNLAELPPPKKIINNKKIKIVFFGTPELAVSVLEELNRAGFTPDIIITAPDRPKGRGLELSPPPVKVWAQKNNIPILQPEKLDTNFIYKLKAKSYQLFIVAAYGKIIPKEILELPTHGTLNVHPSLLPEFRGSSPIESAILSGKEKTGVSIMVLDEKMDHGPILEQEEVPVGDVAGKNELSETLFRMGGQMLSEIIPKWVSGKIKAAPQDESRATYTKKISKEDGLIDLAGDPISNFRKIRAYEGWPGTYFFTERNNKKTRVVIKDAELKNGALVIKKVVPEGKKEMDYEVFAKSTSL